MFRMVHLAGKTNFKTKKFQSRNYVMALRSFFFNYSNWLSQLEICYRVPTIVETE